MPILAWVVTASTSIWRVPNTVIREGNGTPLQYSCLEKPMDGGAWWATLHGVAKSRTPLSDFTFTFHFHALEKEMATHSSVLAWRIPETGEPGGLPSMGSHRVGHEWSDLAVGDECIKETFYMKGLQWETMQSVAYQQFVLILHPWYLELEIEAALWVQSPAQPLRVWASYLLNLEICPSVPSFVGLPRWY